MQYSVPAVFQNSNTSASLSFGRGNGIAAACSKFDGLKTFFDDLLRDRVKRAASKPEFERAHLHREMLVNLPAKHPKDAADALVIMYDLLEDIQRAFDRQAAAKLASGEGSMLCSIVDDGSMGYTYTTELRRNVDEEGLKTINNYTILNEIGRGRFGKVKLAFDEVCRELRAIKIVSKSTMKKQWEAETPVKVENSEKGFSEAMAKEFVALKQLRHRNIVKLYEVIDDPQSQKLYLVLQHIDSGPLFCTGRERALPLMQVQSYMRQLLDALKYMHRKNVVHRDIKPENILCDGEGRVFFTDFGVSDAFSDGNAKVRNTSGTPLFFSPEMLREENCDGKAVDVWALGVTFYIMLFGKYPYGGVNYFDIRHRILHTNPDLNFALRPNLHELETDMMFDAVDLLTQMLRRDTAQRPTASACLKHSFFSCGTQSSFADLMSPRTGEDLSLTPSVRRARAEDLEAVSNAELEHNELQTFAMPQFVLSQQEDYHVSHGTSPPDNIPECSDFVSDGGFL